MGEEGTWTIFVYICGSDLESENGMASMDMEEMERASTGSDVKFVLETGGANSWENGVSRRKLERYVICDGNTERVDSLAMANMGESSTLADFLKWGVAEYPAGNMGLVLWNHGSGSINGVCFDENEDYDSLLLKELDAALCSVRPDMTENFEFIGFDACLMATIETANLMSAHANYLIASEETEPGYGWDYEAIGTYLGENPSADGEELGRVVCKSFYEACDEIGAADGATLSVTDLSRIGAVTSTFDTYAKDLYDLADSGADFTEVARGIASADNYGGNNRSEGYTNMVDIAGIVEAGKGSSNNAQPVLDAIDNAVVYKVNGSDHKNASGLSAYYPLQVQGSSELTIFQDICVSSYYLGLVDKIAYGYVNADTVSDYYNMDLLDSFINDWSGNDYELDDDGDYIYEEDTEEGYSLWDFLDDLTEVEGESSAITFDTEPYLADDGTFGFVLSQEGLDNTESVEAMVFLDLGGDDLICIGETTDVIGDFDTGEFYDNFDGYWFSLPDGQPLCTYLVETSDGYDVFTTPILLNGQEKYLRFMWNYQTGAVTPLDVWDGIDDITGAAGRPGEQLGVGDTIAPLYDAYDYDGNESGYYTGDNYTYRRGDELAFSLLFDGDYYYSFCVNDIYGNYYLTDPVNFIVDGDQIYFTE